MGTLLLLAGKVVAAAATVVFPFFGAIQMEPDFAPAPPGPGAPMVAPGEIPVARPVPGKPGFCFNPFTGGVVDVQGIPAGTLVKDPADPDHAHLFRIP